MPLNEITLPDGSTRRMGNRVPVSATPRHEFTEFGSTSEARVIPHTEWDALLDNYEPGFDSPFLQYVHDQNGIGQCNPEAAAAAMEYARAMQGLPFVKLSAADLYARINGGRDQGSMLEDAMDELLKHGIGTAETSGTLWKNGVFKGQATDAERGRFRALEVYTCPTFAHCFSAVLQGFALISGIMWYDNYTPDKDGWLPRPAGTAGGHAIMGYKPVKRNQSYGIWHQNSWSTQWGMKGHFVIPESSYDGPVGGWYAVRTVVDEGGVVPTES